METCYRQTLLGQIDQKWLGRREVHWALLVLLAAVLIVPSVQSVARIRKSQKSAYRAGGERQSTALGRWLPTAKVMADGSADPYGPGHWFPTPPFVLMCLVPFYKMGFVSAAVVWATMKVAGFVITMALLIRELGRGGFKVPVGVLLAAGIFGIRPIISDLQHANLNIFVMIWIGLAWVLYLRGRDFLAGMLTALAIVTKVTPALLLLYFLYKRRWRICLGAAIGLAIFVLIIPGAYLGFQKSIDEHVAWYHMLVEPYAKDGWVTLEIANQSLYGALVRVLSNAGVLSVERMPMEKAMAVGMEDMARPVSVAGKLIRPAISLGGLVCLGWLCRKGARRSGTASSPKTDSSLEDWMELSLVLLAMLLMGERTWKHHATTLPIVYLAMWYGLTCWPLSEKFRSTMVAGLAVQFVLLVIGGEGFFGDRIADQMLEGGFFCWGLVLAAVQTAMLLIKIRRISAEEAMPQG